MAKKSDKSDMICQLCKSERKAGGHNGRPLVKLPNAGIHKGIIMYACPHCDGPVVDIATREA